jgi:hypothetical protein
MMQPDAHLRQHFTVEDPRVDGQYFRPAWFVRSRLDQLRHAGAISPREWIAAVRYRWTWEAAQLRPRSSQSLVQVSSCRGADTYTISQLDALTALRAVFLRIGRNRQERLQRIWLIQACVVDDMSWRALGHQLGVHHHTARERTIGAIKALGEREAMTFLGANPNATS